MELLSTFIVWLSPAVCSQEITIYLDLFAFTSSPISLVPLPKKNDSLKRGSQAWGPYFLLLSLPVHPNSKQSTPQVYMEATAQVKFQLLPTSQNEASKSKTDGLVQLLANRTTAHQQVAQCSACLQIAQPLCTAAQEAQLGPTYWTLFTLQFLANLMMTTEWWLKTDANS